LLPHKECNPAVGSFSPLVLVFSVRDVNKRLAVVLGWHPSLFEYRVIDGEIFLPQLPQDQRSRIDPYLDIPPSMGYGPVASIPKSCDGSGDFVSRCRD